MTADGSEHADRDGHGNREGQREHVEPQCDRRRIGKHLADRRAGANDRIAEITGEDVAKPGQVLDVRRLVKTPLVGDGIDLFLAHLGLADQDIDRAAGRELQDDERRQGHQKDDDQALQQPLNDVPEHHITPAAWGPGTAGRQARCALPALRRECRTEGNDSLQPRHGPALRSPQRFPGLDRRSELELTSSPVRRQSADPKVVDSHGGRTDAVAMGLTPRARTDRPSRRSGSRPARILGDPSPGFGRGCTSPRASCRGRGPPRRRSPESPCNTAGALRDQSHAARGRAVRRPGHFRSARSCSFRRT